MVQKLFGSLGQLVILCKTRALRKIQEKVKGIMKNIEMQGHIHTSNKNTGLVEILKKKEKGHMNAKLQVDDQKVVGGCWIR